MKKLLVLLFLLPTLLFSQTTDSWVQFVVQYDFYGHTESNFFMVEDTISGDTVMFHSPSNPYEILDTIININSGDYVVTLTDSYGDGWNSQQPAWFKMKNQCQGEILNYDPLTMMFFTLDTLVSILPCAPPTIGCLDPSGLDYDSTAYLPGPCTYPPCGGFLTSNVQQTCLPTGQTLVQFFWQNDTSNGSCNPVRFWYWNEDGAGPFQYGLGPNQQDFAVYAGNGQMPPNWSVEHYGMVEFADSTFSDTMTYTPTPCIAGCTDSAQPTYNPWATFDDGSCSGTTCDTNLTYQITMEITFDNWPSETGWSITSGGYGVLQSELPGTYNFNDIGQTYTYDFCVDKFAGFELIVTDTYGDGMAGTTSGGTLDGMVVIYDCLGDTIWWMDNPGFGNTLYSGAQMAVPCDVQAPIYGCMDSGYQEYNPLATADDSSCVNLHIYGCTDPAAYNYDSTATVNDIVPSCQYKLFIEDAGGDGWGNSYIGVYQNGVNFGTFTMGPGSYIDSFPLVLDAGIPVHVYYFEVGGPQQPPQEVQFQTWHNSFRLTNADGVVLMSEGTNPFANNGQGALQSFDSPFWTTYSAIPYCGDYCIEAIYGCMNPLSFNYNDTANIDDGSCVPVILGCTNTLAFNYDSLANVDDGNCIPISYGCTDMVADNYNSNANTDDGSCYYVGCTDITALNYDSTATVNNGCIYPVYGCTDPTAFNYDPLANVDDTSCVAVSYGCMDATAFNYDPLANTDNGSCEPFAYGCTDSTAFNYDPLANTDNGSCDSIVYGCTNPIALNYNPLANTDDLSCILPIYGCTDSTQFNFNPLANTDNGTCIPFVYGCTNANALNYNSAANTDDGSCILPIYGCTDSTMYNYNPLANVDNGSCEPFIYGCNDAAALNYNPLANTSDNTCCYISGCTDPTALNYDPAACVDDNSCIEIISGCTDVAAFNYDPLANVSDSTACLYDAGCYGGPGNPYWLNDGCYAWVIDVDGFCCTDEWDASCQSMYDYCQLGWPTSIEDISSMGIVVYPNPTGDVLNIDTRLDVEVEIYDMTGRLMIKEDSKRIDLSNYTNGVYNLILIYNNKRFTTRVVKQ